MLKNINKILSVSVFALGLYLVISPFWPIISFQYEQNSADDSKRYKYKTQLAQKELKDTSGLSEIPEGNRIIIPKIFVDTNVHEGQDASTLNFGIWRRPNSSTPKEGSNTVLTGHRYMYHSGPNTFYNLDKMEVGDKLAIIWDSVEYDYEVEEVYEAAVRQGPRNGWGCVDLAEIASNQFEELGVTKYRIEIDDYCTVCCGGDPEKGLHWSNLMCHGNTARNVIVAYLA